MKLKSVISHFGTAKNLAHALGINPSAISLWNGEIPRLRQYEIERITNGLFKVQDQEKAA